MPPPCFLPPFPPPSLCGGNAVRTERIWSAGDVTRESIILFSGDTYKSRVGAGVPVKLGEMKLVDAVEEGLGLEGIVRVLQDESSPCLGVAFRHYHGTKSWKSGNSMIFA